MSSGFVSESEIAEVRRKRQEEWEKVRKASDPLDRPEEVYDGRSLYDRLKEQKMQKDLEYEETHKLKNLIRGLDEDEVHFLELVDKSKLDAEKKQIQEEEQELKDYRNRVATLQEQTVDKKIQSEIKLNKGNKYTSATCTKPTQKSLLSTGIKRRNGKIDSEATCSNAKPDETNTDNCSKKPFIDIQHSENAEHQFGNLSMNGFDKGALKCVAILPGIGTYTESSNSEMSSGSDDEPEQKSHYDLVGRKRQKKKQTELE